MQAIRAQGQAGTKVGPADNIQAAVPAIETAENIRAPRSHAQLNAMYLTVILEGRYPQEYLAAASEQAPRFTEADLKIISSPLDFVGINVYLPAAYVRASHNAPGYEIIPFAQSHPKMLSSWHYFGLR